MAGGLTVSVRQIASYPLAVPTANDLVLVQSAGLGGPYSSIGVGTLISQGLASGPAMGIGHIPPADSDGASIFLDEHTYPDAGRLLWNAYVDNQGNFRQWTAPTAGQLVYSGASGFSFQTAPAVATGDVIARFGELFAINPAGAAVLPFGTLSVARDPVSVLEVATLGWVGRSTVASFNGRRGVVTLDNCDIAMALGYPVECIATLPQVDAKICQAIQDLIHTYPAVWSWNGRVGDVWLNVGDMNWATMAPGAIALTVPTPPADSNDSTVPSTAWVIQYLTETSGLATEAWVTQQIAAINLGVTTFNGRQGAVTLTYLDVATLGFAPMNSPSFSGIPTAPTAATGTSTAQLATTAFVMNTLTAISPGVISFNGRSGTVDLTATDLNNAGGALLASPNFTGTPAAPTAAQGTSSTQIATTAFVMNEITAVSSGVVSFNGRSGIVTLQTADITAAGGAPNASPALTGIPTAPTAANGTNTQQLATTAFVLNEINAINAGVLTFNGRSGTVTLTQNDVTAVGGLVNPSAALTGTPTAPTPAPTDSSTNIATTAFVHGLLASYAGAAVGPTPPSAPNTGSLWFNTSATPPYLNVWNGTAWVASTNTSAYAPLASPALSGTPSAPTALAGTATTQLATTAFVSAAVAASVLSFNGRSGAVTLATADITGAGGAPLASPTFTGTVTIPATASITAPNITGVSNGTQAATGQVGEFVLGAGNVTMGSGFTVVAQLALTPGSWLIWGYVVAAFGTGVTMVALIGYLSSVANAAGPVALSDNGFNFTGFPNAPAGNFTANAGPALFNISTPSTVYFNVAQQNPASGNVGSSAVITALRIR